MKTKRALEQQPAAITAETSQLELIENFTDIRADVAFIDQFMSNILTSQQWHDYAKTLIVGNVEYDTFIKREFEMFQMRVDIYTCL